MGFIMSHLLLNWFFIKVKIMKCIVIHQVLGPCGFHLCIFFVRTFKTAPKYLVHAVYTLFKGFKLVPETSYSKFFPHRNQGFTYSKLPLI